MDDTDEPPQAAIIAGAWHQYQTRILPAVLDEPTPEAVDLAQLSFYFGAIALLGILGAALDGAESEEVVTLVREALDSELSDYVESRETDLH
jgi:hypothetical protein